MDVGGRAGGEIGERTRHRGADGPIVELAAHHESIVVAVPRRRGEEIAGSARTRGPARCRRWRLRGRRRDGGERRDRVASRSVTSVDRRHRAQRMIGRNDRSPRRRPSSMAIIQSGRLVPCGVTCWASVRDAALEVGGGAGLLAERRGGEHDVGELRRLGRERVDGDDPARAGEGAAREVGVGTVVDRIGAERARSRSILPSAAACSVARPSWSGSAGASPSGRSRRRRCRGAAPAARWRRAAPSRSGPQRGDRGGGRLGQVAAVRRRRRRGRRRAARRCRRRPGRRSTTPCSRAGFVADRLPGVLESARCRSRRTRRSCCVLLSAASRRRRNSTGSSSFRSGPSRMIVEAAAASSMVARGSPSTSAGSPSPNWASRYSTPSASASCAQANASSFDPRAPPSTADARRPARVERLADEATRGIERGVPRRRRQAGLAADQRLGEALVGLVGLEVETAAVAQPAPVDRVACRRPDSAAPRRGSTG